MFGGTNACWPALPAQKHLELEEPPADWWAGESRSVPRPLFLTERKLQVVLTPCHRIQIGLPVKSSLSHKGEIYSLSSESPVGRPWLCTTAAHSSAVPTWLGLLTIFPLTWWWNLWCHIYPPPSTLLAQGGAQLEQSTQGSKQHARSSNTLMCKTGGKRRPSRPNSNQIRAWRCHLYLNVWCLHGCLCKPPSMKEYLWKSHFTGEKAVFNDHSNN